MNLKQLQLIHLGMLGGQTVFAAVAYFLQQSGTVTVHNEDLVMPLSLILVVAFAGGLGASHFVFNSMLSKAKEQGTLDEKLAAYRQASIIQFALFEGPSIFAFIAYLVTGNILFWGAGLAATLLFILLRPSEAKLAKELELSNQEKQKLQENF